MNLNKYTTKLGKLFNHEIDYRYLYDNAKEYYPDTSRLRIFYLGLKIGENNPDKLFINNFFSLFQRTKDLSTIWSQFTIWNLGEVINNCKDFPNCENAVQEVINLYEKFGDNIPKENAESAERSAASAARNVVSAEIVALSAAWSTVRSAESAASVTWSAANAARSVARSAESAARSATWSAESAARSAARSAESAAWSAAWDRQGKYLLSLLDERIKEER